MHCLMRHCFPFVFPTPGNYMYNRLTWDQALFSFRFESLSWSLVKLNWAWYVWTFSLPSTWLQLPWWKIVRCFKSGLHCRRLYIAFKAQKLLEVSDVFWSFPCIYKWKLLCTQSRLKLRCYRESRNSNSGSSNVSRHHIADLINIDYFNLIERFLSCTVPPSFNSFSPDQVVVESDPATITLSCSADGNPAPKVNWTRVFDNGSDSDVLGLFTGNSYVMNNNRINAGTYRCKADNGIGSAINQTIRVTVNCKYSAFPSING